LRKEIESKIEKFQEPDPVRHKRALPVPEDKKPQRRGGKRARKFKERFGITEVRSEANKMAMSGREDDEYGDSAMGLDKGMLGQSGRIRGATQKVASFLGKKQKKALDAYGARAQEANSLAALVFSDAQGLELVNPNARAEKEKEKEKTKGTEAVAPKSYFGTDNF